MENRQPWTSRGAGHGSEGTQAVAVGGAQPQSQYFQSFNQSHVTPPPSRPPVYTTQQKNEAVRLLNKGVPAKKIAEHIGGTCSKNNPYRWREEELGRERRAEADRERQIQQERAQAAWNRQQRIQLIQIIGVIILGFAVLFAVCCAFSFLETFAIALTLDLNWDPMAFTIWALWNVILLFCSCRQRIITPVRHVQLHFSGLAILWIYLLYYYPVYANVFLNYRTSRPKLRPTTSSPEPMLKL